MTISIDELIRVLTREEAAAYLRRRHWWQVSRHNSQAWLAPGWTPSGVHGATPPDHDPNVYSLAAALRTALTEEQEQP
jgi:hypothetical protein